MSLIMPMMLVVANVMGVGMIVPQAWRLRRTGVVDGVSGVWVGVGLAMNLWWSAYVTAERLWGALPVSVGGFSLYLVIAWSYVRLVGRPSLRPLAVGALVLGAVPLPFLLIGGWSLAGLAIGFSYGVQFAPAASAAVRSTRLDGISPATWTMALIEAAIWFAYGAMVADPALVVGGGGGAIMASVIVWRLVVVAMPSRQAAIPA